MSDMYNLRIIAADRVFYEGPCLSLIVPAFDGEKEVLAHHEAMVIAVTDGEMRYKTEDGTWHIGYVGHGFVQIHQPCHFLLTESAEKPEEIDIRRAEARKKGLWNSCVRNRVFRNTTIPAFHWPRARLV